MRQGRRNLSVCCTKISNIWSTVGTLFSLYLTCLESLVIKAGYA